MDALVEVHVENELQRALRTDAPIIGINNRSFADLRVDVAVTQRLAPLVPGDRLVVSESGILHHDHVRLLRPLVDAFLVGSALMAQENLTAACGELIYGRVKVCGLTRRDDALAAAAAGVQFGGLIFAKKSPRYLDIRDAGEVCRDVPLRWVGVFADAPPSVVADTANHLRLHAVQLHGMENRDYLNELKQVLAGGVAVWKALAVTDAMPSPAEFDSCRILLDAGSGGSGTPFDWHLLDRVDVREMVLAGGLNERNGARADALGAFALDVNSGIESAPGKKDVNQLNAFLAALRGTGRSHT
jgi:indole-3-glycerol phosphate synthase/phosphoribosylanthranilate isomerase